MTMVRTYRKLLESSAAQLQKETWLVTGAAGFIGSHLTEALLANGCKVIGLDNFSTGKPENLAKIKQSVGDHYFANFNFIEGDVRDIATCKEACRNANIVLHQAALGSVPRSIEHPERTTETNISGFVNILTAAKDSPVRRVVYASSSSVYGDEPTLPKKEGRLGRVLSPYALTKLVNEQFAAVFSSCFNLESVGLRYFNVFGPRQDPLGAYAAVVPRWISAVLSGEPVTINGDGETSRDFCFVTNVVNANLLAALSDKRAAINRVYNVACEEATSLNELLRKIIRAVEVLEPDRGTKVVTQYAEFRAGDIRHSLADTSCARDLLNYMPVSTIDDGLAMTVRYFLDKPEGADA